VLPVSCLIDSYILPKLNYIKKYPQTISIFYLYEIIQTGVLAITRALGDHAMKPSVVATPYTSETVLRSTDSAVIIACDGLWDVMTDEEASELVTKSMHLNAQVRSFFCFFSTLATT
jgi:hypothetical protein